MNVGEYIKMLRTQKGLTQEELGELVGVKRAAVNKWESGMVQNLKRTTIKKLSEIFQVSPVSFIDEEVKVKFISTDAPAAPLLTPKERRLITAYNAHPELQPAVDKLLSIEGTDEETETVYIAARSDNDEPPKAIKIPKSKLEAMLADKSIQSDDDL